MIPKVTSDCFVSIYLTDKGSQLMSLLFLILISVSGALNSHLDRHENIGKGMLGMKFFNRMMKDERFKGIPMILETPCEDNSVYAKEIKTLYEIVNN